MPLLVDGNTGISGIDGTAAAPSVSGLVTTTGLFFSSAVGVGVSIVGSEKARFASNGCLGIQNNTPSSFLTIGAGNTTYAPLQFTSGTNVSAPAAGEMEYDGNVLTFTPSTNYGRATIPSTVYTSGSGTNLTPTATGEATAQALFPAPGDTITLPIGTYNISLVALITRGATSTTSATARINLGGGGTAVGTFSGTSISSIAAGGASSLFTFNAAALTVDNVVTAALAVAGGVYNIYLTGILRITTAGTFIPKYSLSAALTGATTATTPSALNYMIIQNLATNGTVAATGGWA